MKKVLLIFISSIVLLMLGGCSGFGKRPIRSHGMGFAKGRWELLYFVC